MGFYFKELLPGIFLKHLRAFLRLFLEISNISFLKDKQKSIVSKIPAY
jgi:hypothetical protein